MSTAPGERDRAAQLGTARILRGMFAVKLENPNNGTEAERATWQEGLDTWTGKVARLEVTTDTERPTP